MKNSREHYEEKALTVIDQLLAARPATTEGALVNILLANTYATLAAAANDEHTHYYPHKLVAQLPWDEQPKAAREALRGVRKGRTTVTGEKLQHDAAGEPGPKMCPGGEAVNNHNGDPACPRCGWSQPPPDHAPGVRGQMQFVTLIARAHPDAGRQG